MNSKLEVKLTDMLLVVVIVMQIWIALEIRGLRNILEMGRP